MVANSPFRTYTAAPDKSTNTSNKYTTHAFSSHLLSSPFYYLSLLVVTQIRGHIAQALLPPYPLRFVPCIFIARRFQLFLPSSTRVELCLPTLGALSSWSFFIFANKFKISPRRDSNSRINTSSIRGLPLVHGGDRLRNTLYGLYVFRLVSRNETSTSRVYDTQYDTPYHTPYDMDV